MASGVDDDYTNNLRSSSYAMLKPAIETVNGHSSHDYKSLMPQQDSRPLLSSATPASLFQSLPYIGSNLVGKKKEETASRLIIFTQLIYLIMKLF